MALVKAVMSSGALCVLLFSGCGRWKQLDSQTSPDGRYEVIVKSNKFFIDATLAIDLKTGASSKTVWTDPHDRGAVVVQIVWTKDSSRFGIIEFDQFAPMLIFAYDVKEQRKIDSALIVPEIRRALIQRYRLEQQAEHQQFDPIEWVKKRLQDEPHPLLD